jgi:hypothetical protein
VAEVAPPPIPVERLVAEAIALSVVASYEVSWWPTDVSDSDRIAMRSPSWIMCRTAKGWTIWCRT